MRTPAANTACGTCGTAAPTDIPPYTWSLSVDATGRSWTCVPCSRKHLATIESRGRLATIASRVVAA